MEILLEGVMSKVKFESRVGLQAKCQHRGTERVEAGSHHKTRGVWGAVHGQVWMKPGGRWRGEAVQLRILPPLSLRPPDPIRGSWGSGGSGKGRRGQGQGLGTHGAGRGLPERLRGSEALRAGHRDTRGGGGRQAGRMRLAR